jgi:hypothetical protein
MRVESAGMVDWWKRELIVRDDALEWEVWRFRERIKMHLPYERIASVQLLLGRHGDDIQITGRNAAEDLVVRGVDPRGAERVKAVIDQRIGA